GAFDAIFINAGATHARPEWLAALRPGGRMVLPLTVDLPNFPHGIGVMLRLDHQDDRWTVRVVSQVRIYDCAGARDPAREKELMALASPAAVRRLHAVLIEPHPRGEACLVH